MTGYGSAVYEDDRLLAKAELKAVNNKFLEVNLRIPRILQSRDTLIRNLTGRLCERGTITLLITWQNKQMAAPAEINEPLLKLYLEKLRQIAQDTGAPETSLTGNAWQLPEVLQTQEQELNQEDWQICEQLIQQAFKEFDGFRTDDGKGLETLFEGYVKNISTHLGTIDALDKLRIERIRERIKGNLEAGIGMEGIDPVRFEQELIFYVEKLDISEEKNRLARHCDYFLKTMKQESSGKRLNFIAQEMGREINTIGSKANDFDIQQLVVMMKDDLEKIKEQTMNIV